MKNKVLSYCLFKPKIMPAHRTHDSHKNDEDRYWFNIPAVAITNYILYPKHEMRLYLTLNIVDHPLFEILSLLEKETNLSTKIIDMDYAGTEPAIWRMMPLWEPETAVVHMRDIDSIPTEVEYRYTMAFEESSCTIGTLRTHANHYGIKCRMLAGLSSFKPEEVPGYMKYGNFYTYYAMRPSGYGSDQDMMIQQFTTNPDYTQEHFYDHCAYFQNNPQDFPCKETTKDELDSIPVTSEQESLFSLLQKFKLDNWAGEPVDARGPYTNHLLSFFPAVEREIKSSIALRSFYIKGGV